MPGRALFVLTLIAVAVSMAGQPRENVPTVSLCELTGHPKTYAGKVVRVRATYRAAFEASFLDDRQCTARRVWTTFSPQVGTETAPRVLRRWERAFSRDEARPCDNVYRSPAYSVDATFLGRFAAHRGGFGHLNG